MAKEASGVKIMVRVRPPLPRELAFDTAVEVLSGTEIVAYKPEHEFASVYDVVLGESSTQDDTYKQVKGTPRLLGVLPSMHYGIHRSLAVLMDAHGCVCIRHPMVSR